MRGKNGSKFAADRSEPGQRLSEIGRFSFAPGCGFKKENRENILPRRFWPFDIGKEFAKNRFEGTLEHHSLYSLMMESVMNI